MKYIIALFSVIVFYACSTSKASDVDMAETARLSTTEATPTQVGVMKVKKGSFYLEMLSNGRLEARNAALVPFIVQEQIVDVVVKEGERVERGALLGRVEPFTYKKRLDDAANNYEKALIDLEDLLLGHGYALADTATVPAPILKMVHIRSGYNQALSALSEAKRNLTYTSIVAPISGVVCDLQARQHNPSAAYKYFCKVLDVANMNLVFTLLETEAGKVRVGEPVEVQPFALPKQTFIGTVTGINPGVDDKGMVRITATVANTSKNLIDGMNARVLLKNEVPNCIIVPKQAVLYRQNRKVIFVHQNNQAIWTYVETSHENSTHIVVTDGLTADMEIIVDNNLNLAHESEVVKK